MIIGINNPANTAYSTSNSRRICCSCDVSVSSRSNAALARPLIKLVLFSRRDDAGMFTVAVDQ